MTQQDKYLHRVQQGATVPSMRAIFAHATLEAFTDADSRIETVNPSVDTLIDIYLHDYKGIDRSVTALIDPLDYYLYNITSPGEQA